MARAVRTSLVAWALVLAAATLHAHAADREVLTIRLRPDAEISTRTVTVADVADLSGGQESLRRRVAKFDVGELGPREQVARITQRQVLCRLRISDVPQSLCIVCGAAQTEVRARLRKLTADDVVAAARKALQAHLPWRADEVQIDLTQPVVVPLPEVGADERLEIRSTLHPRQRPPGRVQMDTQILVGGEHRLALAVHFDVRPCIKVAVCRRRIDRGEAFTADNVFIEERPVDQRSSLVVNPDLLKGKAARGVLLPGQVVTVSDLGDAEASGSLVVKNNDGVRIQVKIGNLKVTAAGQALQDGRVGQVIRVQNVDTKKTLLGKVIESGLVEVE